MMVVVCIQNLKGIGLANQQQAADQGESQPVEAAPVPTAAWRYFQSLSNKTQSAHIFVCPADKQRTKAENFGNGPNGLGAVGSRNEAVSYFAGLGASEATPQMILAGDRNLSTTESGVAFSSIGRGAISVGTNVTWTTSIPMHALQLGSVLFADGHVEVVAGPALAKPLAETANAYDTNANKFLFPQ